MYRKSKFVVLLALLSGCWLAGRFSAGCRTVEKPDAQPEVPAITLSITAREKQIPRSGIVHLELVMRNNSREPAEIVDPAVLNQIVQAELFIGCGNPFRRVAGFEPDGVPRHVTLNPGASVKLPLPLHYAEVHPDNHSTAEPAFEYPGHYRIFWLHYPGGGQPPLISNVIEIEVMDIPVSERAPCALVQMAADQRASTYDLAGTDIQLTTLNALLVKYPQSRYVDIAIEYIRDVVDGMHGSRVASKEHFRKPLDGKTRQQVRQHMDSVREMIGKKDLAKAEEHLREVIRLEPGNAEAWEQLGDIAVAGQMTFLSRYRYNLALLFEATRPGIGEKLKKLDGPTTRPQ